MLQLSSIYYGRKILSLRTGSQIGQAHSPLINPGNLKIEGWYAIPNGERETSILLATDVRDIIAKGIVVDDHTALVHPDDLVRLKKIINIGYEVIGKIVQNEQKKRIGKVQDYAVETDSLIIKKLYVSQSLIKNFGTNQLIIDRNQIVELNDHAITIREATEKVTLKNRAVQPA